MSEPKMGCNVSMEGAGYDESCTYLDVRSVNHLLAIFPPYVNIFCDASHGIRWANALGCRPGSIYVSETEQLFLNAFIQDSTRF
jgi:hypothetical protein